MTRIRPKRTSEMHSMGLRYVSDILPGISRVKIKKNFLYKDASGLRISTDLEISRIRQLAIPPAWTQVWICQFANGHIQATGRDARGRKQYRYHKNFRAHQDDTKFTNIIEFAHALPQIRRRVNKDLNQKGLPRERVLAVVVQLLERTLIRVGNQEYAEHNHSFGLSTLLNKHASHCGEGVRFMFIGKSGVQHNVEVADHRLAKIIFNCRDLPGQHLFEFKDHLGKIHAITSADVNHYIQECSKQDFTAKNFRTWRGTVIAALAFERLRQAENGSATKRLVASVVRDVSSELRNTPATCRKYYIHPKLIEAFEAGNYEKLIKRARLNARRTQLKGLTVNEQTVLLLIKNL